MNNIIQFLDNIEKIEDEDLFYYFKPNYTIFIKKQTLHLHFSLNFPSLKNNIIDYDINDKGQVESYCYLCRKNHCQHMEILISKVYQENKEKMIKLIKEFDLKVESERKIKQQKEFFERLSLLSNSIDKQDYYDSINKIQLVLVLDDIQTRFSLKIGRIGEKRYNVQNIKQLLTDFRIEGTNSYGKELSFSHSLSILDEASLNLYLLIEEEVSYTISLKAKYGFVQSESTMKNLIYSSKNSVIIINGIDYQVTLNERKPKILIDKNYQLNVLLNENEEVFFDFIKNNQNKTINVISYDENYKELILNILKYKDISIEDMLDDFKSSIYLKYAELFELDESIAENFMKNSLKIQAYFDFDNQEITFTEKLFCNDHEILKGQLNRSSLKIYSKFRQLLIYYGFVDGKISEESDIINFLNADLSDLKKIAEVFLSETLKRLKVEGFNPPSIKADYQNDTLSILLPESDYDNEELKAILSAVKKKKKYVLLKNDRIITLNEKAEDFKQVVEDLNLNEKALLEQQFVSVYNLFKPTATQYHLTVDDYLSNMLSDIAHFKENKVELPTLNATLRPYQREGFVWLKTLTKYQLGGILADDMGLGKTLEIIALLASDVNFKPSLIVCPKSLIFNWMNEFERFAPYIKVQAIYGSAMFRKSLINNISKDEDCVYITSYDSLRLDIDEYKAVQFNYAILDEAQYIKNVFAKKTKSVKLIQASHRFVLTGTPIENNIYDLWSIFDYIMPNYLPKIDDFHSRFERDETYQPILIKKISPFILRRTKTEVLKDLPEKYEVVMTCDMEEEQRKLYDAYRLDAKEKLQMNLITKFGVLTYLTRLRQLCVEPSMFIENYHFGSGKIKALLSIVHERLINKHRILIFSQFVQCLNIIEKNFKMNQINYRIITGETPAQERLNICEDFNKDESIKIVLISLKAGGTGLNLTGADVVIHVDPWWNVAAQNQATDRAHRIGQVKNVEVIKLICENSIEQKVVELQNKKKDLIDKIITNDDSSITNLSLDDMNFILS